MFRCLRFNKDDTLWYRYRMRLQKRFNRKVGSKEYSKWIVNLPPEEVEQLGWKEGIELEASIKDGKIILTPKK